MIQLCEMEFFESEETERVARKFVLALVLSWNENSLGNDENVEVN